MAQHHTPKDSWLDTIALQPGICMTPAQQTLSMSPQTAPSVLWNPLPHIDASCLTKKKKKSIIKFQTYGPSLIFWRTGLKLNLQTAFQKIKTKQAKLPCTDPLALVLCSWSLLYSVLLSRADAYLMRTYFQLNNLVHGQQQGRSRSLLMGRKCSGVMFGLGSLTGRENA